MGGMGFISGHHGTILRNNALIDINTLEAARVNGVRRYLYSSSACVYPEHLQAEAGDIALAEEDAYPANPQDAYGWEKLIGERLCLYYTAEFGLPTRIVRFHNIYGPYGTYDGGREKVPAALCRKVAAAKPGGEIEIWGDGEQTRSFCYVDDCVEGIHRLMRSDHGEPLNLGTEEVMTINELAQSGHRGVRQAGHHAAPCRRARKAFAAATRTTGGCAPCSAGNRRPRSDRACNPPTGGSPTVCAVPAGSAGQSSSPVLHRAGVRGARLMSSRASSARPAARR